jgi:hypothetical protein
VILALPPRTAEIADGVRPLVRPWRPRYEIAVELLAVALWRLEQARVLRAQVEEAGEAREWLDESARRWERQAREVAGDLLLDFDGVARVALEAGLGPDQIFRGRP